MASTGPPVRYQKLRWTGRTADAAGGKTVIFQTQSPNSELVIKATLKLIEALPAFTTQTNITCSEPRGIYNALILAQLSAAGFPLWLERGIYYNGAKIIDFKRNL